MYYNSQLNILVQILGFKKHVGLLYSLNVQLFIYVCFFLDKKNNCNLNRAMFLKALTAFCKPTVKLKYLSFEENVSKNTLDLECLILYAFNKDF